MLWSVSRHRGTTTTLEVSKQLSASVECSRIVSLLNISRSHAVGPSVEVPFSVLSRRALTYSVLAGFIAAFIACPSRYVVLRHWITPPSIQQLWWMPPIIVALEYVAIVLVAAFSGAIAGHGPHVRFDNPKTRRNLALFTMVAVWAAPLMILLLERSAVAGLIAAGMVIGGGFALGIANGQREPTSAPEEQGTSCYSNFPRLDELSHFSRPLGLAIIAAAALQAAGLADWLAQREVALILFVVGGAVLASQLPSGVHAKARYRTEVCVSISAMAALAVVLIGLLPLISSSHGDASLSALLRSLFIRKAGGAVVRSHAVRLWQTPIRSDGYIGVILTPKRQPQAKSSRVPQLLLNARKSSLKNPLHIPFTGSYWFFQDPFLRPPFDSITAEGDPANVSVRAANRKPLQMEAVQTLDEPIDMRELEKIELSMLDVDRDPGTVSVELVLADTQTWGIPVVSLGTEPLDTSLDGGRKTDSRSKIEAFVVPLHSHLERFNQIRLIFRLDPSRNRQAAAIAIESFLLVPRGM